MINRVYQLVRPFSFSIKYEDVSLEESGQVVIRPDYIALCHADQRYYQGKRSPKILQKKLPMALIHECCGVVVHDETGTYKAGDRVVMIPNQPPKGFEFDGEFYENYVQGTQFLSSGFDGFMREFVTIPLDRVVKYDYTPSNVAAISEFVSVGCHAINRFEKISSSVKERIVVWGSGSLGYVVSTLLKELYPKSTIIVVGKHSEKLRLFSFVDELYDVGELPEDFTFDHAFECVGGEATGDAYRDIIKYIKPQGTVIMMGVSELEVPLNTRDILEKGLTWVGSSRSGREDFEKAAQLMAKPSIHGRLQMIVHEADPIEKIEDIYRFFEEDTLTPFKTVAKWNI